jgi:hypothetical protein
MRTVSTYSSDVAFFPLSGALQDSNPRRMAVWPHEERSPVLPVQMLFFASHGCRVVAHDGCGHGRFFGGDLAPTCQTIADGSLRRMFCTAKNALLRRHLGRWPA